MQSQAATLKIIHRPGRNTENLATVVRKIQEINAILTGLATQQLKLSIVHMPHTKISNKEPPFTKFSRGDMINLTLLVTVMYSKAL